ncbi:histidine--tRNA ligase [bacterium]|nr:histidine--tRNA ligase [bacterium]
MLNVAPPSGMRDFLPGELSHRKYLENVIRKIFEIHGFVSIETPAIENLSTLLGKYGVEGDQLIYRILHRREKLSRALGSGSPSETDLAELGLRYDLTVPLARFMANNRDLPRFFRRYQLQPVWRADRPGKGRFREFTQCDVDITGTKSLLAEAEVCGAVSSVLLELGFFDFTIQINHRELLKCLIAAAGLEPSFEEPSLVAIDKLDKIGKEGVWKELLERGITASQAEKLLSFFQSELNCKLPENETSKSPQKEAGEFCELSRLENLLDNSPAAQASKKPLSQLKDLLSIASAGPAKGRLRFDASLARGLSYYTGPIFEIRSPKCKGSLGGGGRYDGLIGMFSGFEIPAVGFSIGFERLAMVMDELNLFPNLPQNPEVLICCFPEISPSEVVRIATILRSENIRVEIFPETPKIGKQIGYAESVGAKATVILGTEEIIHNRLTAKFLSSGEQITLPTPEAIIKIKSWFSKAKPTAV